MNLYNTNSTSGNSASLSVPAGTYLVIGTVYLSLTVTEGESEAQTDIITGTINNSGGSFSDDAIFSNGNIMAGSRQRTYYQCSSSPVIGCSTSV